ncbi:MAG TPA: type II toxin-antitoxin system VapC family toxin [Longimicrobiaceae bacterium]|nr:type II toxin-antitoxin system VapC family toxin [Longimicrobiaceae bacterium]
MRYLLDTNVLSEPARPHPSPHVLAWLKEQSALDMAISVLTLGEIAKGVQLLPEGSRRKSLAAWLDTDLPRRFLGRVLPVSDHVALAWGRLAADARRGGRELPVIDGFLLATAGVHGLTLVTRNERDCTGRGIPIYNPWED